MAPIAKVEELKKSRYFARGMTALNDAVCFAAEFTEAHIKGLARRKRPDKVIFQVFTDGLENASRENSDADLRAKVARMEKMGWEVVFVGANQNAQETGANMGVDPKKAMSFWRDREGGDPRR